MENYSGVVTTTTIIDDDDQMLDYLPPGFRFHPTDEELITHYLSPKVLDTNFHAIAIGQVDFNKVEPWELPKQAKWGEKEWYFFCLRDRKYPTGLRTNRATEAGYWKATGKDKEIYRAKVLVGMKKTLVFYLGRAPKGKKSNWVMHEYRLDGKLPKDNQPKNDKNEWVISRVFEKNSVAKKPDDTRSITPEELHSSYLPPLMDFSPYDSETTNVTTNANSSHVTNHLMLDQQNAYASNANSSHMLNDPGIIMSEYQFVDSFFEQEQSMFRVLLDGKGAIKEELSQDIVHNSSVSDGFDQCLWTY